MTHGENAGGSESQVAPDLLAGEERSVPPAYSRYSRPVDEDHALLVGALVGMVMKSREQGYQYHAEILDDEHGAHLATFAITAPSGRYFVQVVKVAPQ